MAIDKRLKIYDDQGHDVDYDIMADDVKFLPDGKDLPTKLAEMEEEIGEGGYTPPAGGIPKTDLAQSVQTSLGKADTALQPADKTALQAAITSLQNALNALIGGNVQGAIDTFNEVTAFLNGIDTDDPTLKNQLLALNTAITALQTALNTKANSTEVVKSISVNGGTPQPPTNGNVNVVVPTVVLDDAPTAGSNNGVKSGGVKTALDNLLQNLRIVNGEWYVGNTATGVSAQGPAGNVNISDASQLVTILVNDLTTGGAGNILSAEMGKILKIAISTLIDSMGEYCFPNGRPTLSWEGPKCNVTQSLTDVTSDFSATRVDKNGSLEITLSPVDNLHVFLTGDVTVEMPLGTDITSTAWNANTGKVTIADVTDDMVITAKSSTYVQSGLVSMFDGKNRGGVTGEWTDVMDNTRKVMMTNCTEANDHVQFSSSSTAYNSNASVGVDVAPDEGTIEAVISDKNVSSSDAWQTILQNHNGGSNKRLIIAGIMYSNLFNNNAGLFFSQKLESTEEQSYQLAWLCGTSNFSPAYISMSNARAHLNNSWLTRANTTTGIIVGTNSRLALSGFLGASSGNPNFMAGKIYCIRIYSRQLSESEVLQNYKVDQKRFNLS